MRAKVYDFLTFFSSHSQKDQKYREELTKQLVIAITMGHEEKAIALLNAGANLNYFDENGEEFSVLGISLMTPKFSKAITANLLDRGADPNQSANNRMQQPYYSFLPNFLIWQVAAFSGRKEVVEFLKEKCANLTMEIGGFTIVDFLKPQNNPEIQAIYGKTLEVMDNKLQSIYGMNPIKMEDSTIALLEAYESKQSSSSPHEKQAAKERIQFVLKKAHQEGIEGLSALCELDSHTKSIILFVMRLQKNLRNLFNGDSALHAEIADIMTQQPAILHKF